MMHFQTLNPPLTTIQQAHPNALIRGEHGPNGFKTENSVLDYYLRLPKPDAEVVKVICEVNPDAAMYENNDGDLPIAT